MSAPATFEHFERELNRLVEQFGKHLDTYKGANYDEANVRKDFLAPSSAPGAGTWTTAPA